RMGIDRDRDGYLDGDELAAGSDPGDPLSHPLLAVTPPAAREAALRWVRPNPFRQSAEVGFSLARRGQVSLVIYDVLGRQVRTVTRGEWREAGSQSLRWDGRRSDGSAAPAGLY